MKPILFNTEMVQAILEGRKTVDRRVVKPQPICYGSNITLMPHDDDFFLSAEKHWLRCRVCGHDPEYSRKGGSISHHWKPPYRPGDILYVRETWCKAGNDVDKLYFDNDAAMYDGMYLYKADGIDLTDIGKWHPSIHMHKEAARLFLRVTDVRVERLQDMTEDDAFAEGFDPKCPYEHRTWVGSPYNGGYEIMCWAEGDCHNPERWYDKSVPELFGINVWNGTIKKVDLPIYSWDANPWVWVIEFEQISKEEAQKSGDGNV